MLRTLQGNYSDLLVALSAVYSDLRGDAGKREAEEAAAEVRTTHVLLKNVEIVATYVALDKWT